MPSGPDRDCRLLWIAINRRATFTDVVPERFDGTIVVAKLLSVDLGRYDDPVIETVRWSTGAGEGRVAAQPPDRDHHPH